MEARPREVLYYVAGDGKCPFELWFDSLDTSLQGKIDKRIKRLEFGNFGECKSVEEGVHELKMDFGAGYRIYFGLHGLTVVVLLCGGDKKKQDRDIKNAHQYWKDWKEQNRR